MMSSLASSPMTGTGARPDRSRESKRKKKRIAPAHPQVQWKSEAQQRSYFSKLLQALAHARRRGGRSVKETADRTLATAAKGRSRWSRSILSGLRIRVKFRKRQNKRRHGHGAAGIRRSPGQARFSGLRLKGRPLPAVQRKVRVLGRLVPGCGKEPLPVILEEAYDYIKALEMQVRAMTAISQLLSGDSSSSSSAAAHPPLQ